MSDIEVVEKIYASMAAHDLETLAQLIDESCVITQDAALPGEAGTSGIPDSSPSPGRSPARSRRR